MSDENQNLNNSSQNSGMSNNQRPSQPSYSNTQKPIDVTKPRFGGSSAIDASKVSSHTLREQQALEKLAKKVGVSGGNRNSKAPMVKTVVAVILVLVLIALAIIFVMIIGGNNKTQEETFDARVSMQIENKSSLIVLTDSGKEKFREINPGDIVPLSAYVRNANNYSGDVLNTNNGVTPPSIYVRFRIRFILDYKQADEKIAPVMNGKWYKYNKDDENKFGDSGIKEDDGYFYYKGALTFMQRAELFSAIEFVGDNIYWEDGGKYGQIQVEVESVPATLSSIIDSNVWATAPRQWVNDIRLGNYA
jgi:hypothetical protein